MPASPGQLLCCPHMPADSRSQLEAIPLPPGNLLWEAALHQAQVWSCGSERPLATHVLVQRPLACGCGSAVTWRRCPCSPCYRGAITT